MVIGVMHMCWQPTRPSACATASHPAQDLATFQIRWAALTSASQHQEAAYRASTRTDRLSCTSDRKCLAITAMRSRRHSLQTTCLGRELGHHFLEEVAGEVAGEVGPAEAAAAWDHLVAAALYRRKYSRSGAWICKTSKFYELAISSESCARRLSGTNVLPYNCSTAASDVRER